MSLLSNLLVRIRGDKTQLDSTLKGAEKSVGNFGAAIKKVGGVIAAAFSVGAIVAFTKEAAKLAATTEGIKKGFTQIAEPGLLDDLRKATAGTVSDMKLMQTAVQASNFEIPLNKLAKLLEFASARAVQTGQSVEYLTESIILGIGRKSPLILDNLGISAVKLREVLKGSGVEMSTVGDIAAAVGKIAGESLDKMGGMAETAAVKMERLNASLINLKTNLGKVITESKLFTSAMDGLNKVTNDIIDVRESEDKIQKSSISWWDKLIFRFARFTKVGREAIKTMGDTLSKQEELTQEIQKSEHVSPSSTTVSRVENPLAPFANRSNLTLSTALSKRTSGFGQLAGLQMDEIKIAEVTEALQWQQEVVNNLTSAFSDMFANVSGGFDDMINSLVKSLQRYVQEILARAAVLALLNIIAPGSGMAVQAHKNLGSLIPLGGGGGIFGNKRATASVAGPMEFKIYGKDLKTALQRNG